MVYIRINYVDDVNGVISFTTRADGFEDDVMFKYFFKDENELTDFSFKWKEATFRQGAQQGNDYAINYVLERIDDWEEVDGDTTAWMKYL